MTAQPVTHSPAKAVALPFAEAVRFHFVEAAGASTVADSSGKVSNLSLLGTTTNCFDTAGAITIHSNGNPTTGVGNNGGANDYMFDCQGVSARRGAIMHVYHLNISGVPTAAGRVVHYGGKYNAVGPLNVEGGINTRIDATGPTLSASCHGSFQGSVPPDIALTTGNIPTGQNVTLVVAWDFGLATLDAGGYYKGCTVHAWVNGTQSSSSHDATLPAPAMTTSATCTRSSTQPCGMSLFGRPVSNPLTDAQRLRWASGTNQIKFVMFVRFNYPVSSLLNKYAQAFTSNPETMFMPERYWGRAIM